MTEPSCKAELDALDHDSCCGGTHCCPECNALHGEQYHATGDFCTAVSRRTCSSPSMLTAPRVVLVDAMSARGRLYAFEDYYDVFEQFRASAEEMARGMWPTGYSGYERAGAPFMHGFGEDLDRLINAVSNGGWNWINPGG
jgi:hypothetical protein